MYRHCLRTAGDGPRLARRDGAPLAPQHKAEQGALMVTARRGSRYIAREDVEAIADVLNLSVAEVHGVVTFYKDFRTDRPPPTPWRCAGARPASRWAREALYADTRAAAPGSSATTRRSTRSSASATARSARPAPSTGACTDAWTGSTRLTEGGR